MTIWLDSDTAAPLELTHGGLVLGHPSGDDWDLALDSPAADAHQAMLRLEPSGPVVLPLGSRPTLVNGAAISGPTPLEDGDQVGVDGAWVRVRFEGEPAGPPPALWALSGPELGTLPVPASGLVLGGAEDDDHMLAGLAPAAARFAVVNGQLSVRAGQDLSIDGESIGAGKTRLLQPRSSLLLGVLQMKVVSLPIENEAQPDDLPVTRVHLVQTQSGGEVRLSLPTGERSATLFMGSFHLLGALLLPPPPFRAGELLPDATLMPRVLIANGGGDESTFGKLLDRLIAELDKAGLGDLALVERPEHARATRARIPRGTPITVD